ncbi:hypothetical protein PG988_013391 [Apiospora saccharicola]
MASSELAPRLQLVPILRAVLIVFGVFALLNGHSYIGAFYRFSDIRATFAVCWTVVAWNAVCVVAVAVHPHLQRLAGGLPFPVKITVRGRALLSYGDQDESGDGLFAPLTAKLFLSLCGRRAGHADPGLHALGGRQDRRLPPVHRRPAACAGLGPQHLAHHPHLSVCAGALPVAGGRQYLVQAEPHQQQRTHQSGLRSGVDFLPGGDEKFGQLGESAEFL